MGKRRIAVIGSGQSGLVAAHGLVRAGHDVKVYSDRSADAWLNESRPPGTAARFQPALSCERSLGLAHWESDAPTLRGIHLTFSPKVGNRLLTMAARLQANHGRHAPRRVSTACAATRTWKARGPAGRMAMINSPSRDGKRIEALDVLRGFVMILMTLDHSSAAFNAGRTMSDSAFLFPSSTALDPLQFAVRWVTHLCAPSFVFLAGAGLALSVVRRQRAGQSAGAIDRDIALRGLLLVVLDVVWMSWTPRLDLSVIEIGVLSAIGASMLAMVVVRRLPPSIVLVIGIAIIVGGEAIITRLDPNDALAAATMTSGFIGRVLYLYPVLPWMGILFVGWALGHRIAGPGMRSRDWLMLALGAALVFAVVRGANMYGNEHVFRRGGSWIEYLHVSKYPPSLAYVALELAIAFALLAMFWRWKMPWTPMVVLGQTALFYYLIHIHLFKVTATALGMFKNRGLGTVVVGWLVVLIVLYPLCLSYLGLKRRYPRSVLRLI